MKKIWHRRRNIRVPKVLIGIIAALGIGWLLLVFVQDVRPGVLESTVAQSTAANESVTSIFSTVHAFFFEKSELQERIKRLEDNEVALRLEVQIASFLEEENRELRELLNVLPEEGVLASVVAWPPKMAYDTLLIHAREGVSVGDLVLGRGTVPIGTIERIEGEFAYVALFSRGGAQTQIRLGEAVFEMEGRGGGSVRIVAPKEVSVERGDPVFFPYEGDTFIGRIGAIESDPAAATKYLWLTFPQHFYAYTWVSVVPYQGL